MVCSTAASNSGYMTPIRLLLIDDSPEFLESAADFLSRDERVRVVGQALDGQQGVRLAEELAPDLVLMDLTMPLRDGLMAMRQIKERSPTTAVVIVTLGNLEEVRRRAGEAGAHRVIPKCEFIEGVLAVIDSFSSEPLAEAGSESAS
jgi:DNA-binding NarL/FixJ family response regulator